MRTHDTGNDAHLPQPPRRPLACLADPDVRLMDVRQAMHEALADAGLLDGVCGTWLDYASRRVPSVPRDHHIPRSSTRWSVLRHWRGRQYARLATSVMRLARNGRPVVICAFDGPGLPPFELLFGVGMAGVEHAECVARWVAALLGGVYVGVRDQADDN
jgi:hypothetical protein